MKALPFMLHCFVQDKEAKTGRQARVAPMLILGVPQALRLRTLGVNRSSYKINEQRRRDLLTY